jgi:hypothetical protein
MLVANEVSTIRRSSQRSSPFVIEGGECVLESIRIVLEVPTPLTEACMCGSRGVGAG